MANVERQPQDLPGQLSVELIYAPAPHVFETVLLCLPAGASAGDALRASGLGLRLGVEVLDRLRLGLWGRLCGPAEPLFDGDRLELLRPLLIDPMEARRQRLRRDGLRKAPRRTTPRG